MLNTEEASSRVSPGDGEANEQKQKSLYLADAINPFFVTI